MEGSAVSDDGDRWSPPGEVVVFSELLNDPASHPMAGYPRRIGVPSDEDYQAEPQPSPAAVLAALIATRAAVRARR
jgi:hypothetical protein